MGDGAAGEASTGRGSSLPSWQALAIVIVAIGLVAVVVFVVVVVIVVVRVNMYDRESS